MSKLNLKGITLQKIANLDPTKIADMSKNELLSYMQASAGIVNRRIRSLYRLSYGDTSPAYNQLIKNVGQMNLQSERISKRKQMQLLSTKGIKLLSGETKLNKFPQEFTETDLRESKFFITAKNFILSARNFLRAKTSTPQGFEEYSENLMKDLKIKMPKSRMRRFWRVYRALENIRSEIFEDKGGTNPVKNALLEWYEEHSGEYRSDKKLIEAMEGIAMEAYEELQKRRSKSIASMFGRGNI